MAGLVICDASPLIGLGRAGGIQWLHPLFGTVWVPSQVEAELLTGRDARDEAEIRAALKAKWLKTWPKAIEPTLDFDLDDGEGACIQLASAHPGSLVLIDERAGRAIAREQGIAVAGTAAVIGQARMKGLIPSARETFEQLLRNDFRIAPEVIRTVLRRVGEG